MTLKTRSQIKQDFANQGLSLSAWARANGFSTSTVQIILNDNDANPRLKCIRGEAHNIAVALGLKHGVISRDPRQAIVQQATHGSRTTTKSIWKPMINTVNIKALLLATVCRAKHGIQRAKSGLGRQKNIHGKTGL